MPSYWLGFEICEFLVHIHDGEVTRVQLQRQNHDGPAINAPITFAHFPLQCIVLFWIKEI